MNKAFAPGGHLYGTQTKAAEFTAQAWDAIRSYDWTLGSYATIYRKQPAVRDCVSFLARNISQLNPKVFARVGDDDRMELDDHPLAVLLRRPNPLTTRMAFLRDSVADLAIFDRMFWRKVYDNGRLEALVRVVPTSLTKQTRGGRSYYEDADGNQYTRDQLVIMSGYTPDGTGEDGVSPLETLRRILAEDFEAVRNREGHWRNAGRVAGVIERPADSGEWSDEARQRFREGWQAAHSGGENAGKTAVLEDGMTYKAAGWSPKDSEYIEGRRLTRTEACLAYGIPPSVLGMTDDPKANVDAYHRHVYQDVLGPWLTFFQQEIELQLLPEFEVTGERNRIYVEFNFAEKLRGSFEEQLKSLVTSVGVPFMSVDEGRAKVNLPKLGGEEWETPIKPLNVMYGGQPAVTVPTEVPEPEGASLAAALRKFFATQERWIRSAKGRTDDVEAWPWAKWDAELAAAADIRPSEAKEINDNTRQALLDGGSIEVVFEDALNGRSAFLAEKLGGPA